MTPLPSHPRYVSDDASARTRIAWEADVEMARRSKGAMLTYPALGLLAVFATPLHSEFPIASYGFVALCVLGAVLRLRFIRKYPTMHARAAWARRVFDVAAVGMGAMWGVFGAFTLYTYGVSWPSFLMLIYTAGIAAGGTSTLCVRLLSHRCYLAALFLPIVAIAASGKVPDGAAVVMALLVYLAFLIYLGTQLHRQYWQGLAQKEELRIASEAKSTFLANISHEIRTPMSCVLGMTQLMLGSNPSSVYRSQLRVIESSSETMLRLINDLLDMSKAESGHMEIESTPFLVHELVHDVVSAFEVAATRNGIKLRSEIHEDVPRHATGDPARIRQVLMNLLSNAIKFTREGRVTTRVSVVEQARHNTGTCRIAFDVEDTGIGIPASRCDAIFEAFTQADTSTARRFGGTGLGLSISATLASLMGGTLTVTSREGVGSCFRFAIPLAGVDVDNDASGNSRPSTRALRHEATSRTRTRTLRILLAEDSEDNALIQSRLLSMRGHQVTIAKNGQQAVEAYVEAEEGFDAILLDLRMPVLDGFEAAQQIRERQVRERRPHALIIALTAHALKSYEERAHAAGMDGFLTKPVQVPDLLQLIERLAPPRPIHAAQEPTFHTP